METNNTEDEIVNELHDYFFDCFESYSTSEALIITLKEAVTKSRDKTINEVLEGINKKNFTSEMIEVTNEGIRLLIKEVIDELKEKEVVKHEQ